jgi:alginate O-acetyltransferase complex protein AlgI
MLFNSYTFIIFFAVVLVGYYLPLSWGVRKTGLLLASYLFYAAWNPPFVILLWISTVVDWYAARGIERSGRHGRRVLWLLMSLFVNLGLLGYFKYAGFIWDNIVSAAGLAGWELTPMKAGSIVLPVGISFYTFQTLSYTLDVYRRKAKPWHSFLDYALYVTFFPQLVAGPIVRAVDFLPQTEKPKRFDGDRLGWGMTLLVLGLFEKVVLADGLLAPAADALYGSVGNSPDVLSAWTSTMAFSGQISCDFAGYSTCAIGVAMCLGFDIMDNFRFPYAAVGFSDFWRRWHISLSSWLRDYLYIPLGGNRKGRVRTYINLSLTMLLGGLWHGSRWTFVVWGGLHGFYLMVERWLKAVVPSGRFWRRWPVVLTLGMLTHLCVLVTWVFFASKEFPQAFGVVGAMFGSPAEGARALMSGLLVTQALGVSLMVVAVHWVMRNRRIEDVVERTPWLVRALAISAMLIGIVVFSGEDRAFIYFQF